MELTVAHYQRAAREDDEILEAQTAETIRRLRMHRRLGGVTSATCSDALTDDDDDPVIESFQQLQRTVAEGLDSGELSPDDPIVVQYREACRKARGSSGRGFVGDAKLREHTRRRTDDWVRPDDEYIADLERSSAGASESAADSHSAATMDADPAGPPADDPFAVEDGDPFAEDD